MSCFCTCQCAEAAFGGLAMNTSPPNPSVSQSPCNNTGDGGAGALSNALNIIGKWGTAVTGVVAGSKVQGAKIQAKAQTKVATSAINSTTMIVVVIVIALLIYMVAK